MASAADQYVKAHPNPPEEAQKVEAKVSPAQQNNASAALPEQVDTTGQDNATASQEGQSSIKSNLPSAQPGDQSSKTGDLERKLRESAEAFNTVASSSLLPVGWTSTFPEYMASMRTEVHDFSWSKRWWHAEGNIFLHASGVLLGWLITACAISLGAPFWFDMLNKIMVVRSTIKPQEKSQPEASKDKAPAS
jgi:hypothetical protein